MERFVYVQQDDKFEKRNVKVGVADYFFAEIQDGLSAGEVVSLELPKEEREKKTKQVATKRPAGENSGPGAKPGSGINASGTNAESPAGAPSSDSAKSPGNRRKGPGEKGGGSQ